MDPIFERLLSDNDVIGGFSMDLDGNVIHNVGDFEGEIASMYAPVIVTMLMDVNGLLDTRPVLARGAGKDMLKRVVLAYESYSLIIARMGDTVYTLKKRNTFIEEEEHHE